MHRIAYDRDLSPLLQPDPRNLPRGAMTRQHLSWAPCKRIATFNVKLHDSKEAEERPAAGKYQCRGRRKTLNLKPLKTANSAYLGLADDCPAHHGHRRVEAQALVQNPLQQLQS